MNIGLNKTFTGILQFLKIKHVYYVAVFIVVSKLGRSGQVLSSIEFVI